MSGAKIKEALDKLSAILVPAVADSLSKAGEKNKSSLRQIEVKSMSNPL